MGRQVRKSIDLLPERQRTLTKMARQVAIRPARGRLRNRPPTWATLVNWVGSLQGEDAEELVTTMKVIRARQMERERNRLVREATGL